MNSIINSSSNSVRKLGYEIIKKVVIDNSAIVIFGN